MPREIRARLRGDLEHARAQALREHAEAVVVNAPRGEDDRAAQHLGRRGATLQARPLNPGPQTTNRNPEPPPPPSGTNWTRLVPLPVLTEPKAPR
jgi:hypothetical protein